MKLLTLAAAATMIGLCATPALALSCYGGTQGVGISLNFRFGDITESDAANFDLMRLQRAGVDASSVEYWNGCIRAWVRNDDGRGEHMEFYNPRTLERVYE
jgi:hypothetical protein